MIGGIEFNMVQWQPEDGFATEQEAEQHLLSSKEYEVTQTRLFSFVILKAYQTK